MIPQIQTGLDVEPFAQLVSQVREIGKTKILPFADDVDSKARFPQEAITALKEAKLLSAYVPTKLGGMGLNIVQMAKICEILGEYCGSTAMVFAMHQVLVACLVHHSINDEYFCDYLTQLVDGQRLIASATTEVGTNGDLLSSICAVHVDGEKFTLNKQAPVISYGEAADDLMMTCRRSEDAQPGDQLHVLLMDGDYELEHTLSWDTLGFRGTCSDGYNVTSAGNVKQIFPESFAEILSESMHPCAHMLWGSLWIGIAADAVNKARSYVRNLARKKPEVAKLSAMRLAEVTTTLQELRNNMYVSVEEYKNILTKGDKEAINNFGFAIHTNNLKISCSELMVDIVSKSMMICGLSAYRNDSKDSLCRHLRDAYGAALMINNDRLRGHNATMLMVHRES
jgi:acyl-CoA dehydrogenase